MAVLSPTPLQCPKHLFMQRPTIHTVYSACDFAVCACVRDNSKVVSHDMKPLLVFLVQFVFKMWWILYVVMVFKSSSFMRNALDLFA